MSSLVVSSRSKTIPRGLDILFHSLLLFMILFLFNVTAFSPLALKHTHNNNNNNNNNMIIATSTTTITTALTAKSTMPRVSSTLLQMTTERKPLEVVSYEGNGKNNNQNNIDNNSIQKDSRNNPMTTKATSTTKRNEPNNNKSSSSSSLPFSVRRCQNVNFASPLLDYGYPPAVREFIDNMDTTNDNNNNNKKPILLYLPGFDGTYICPFIQYPELGTEFEIWCMTVGMDDRSTYNELKQNVLDFIYEIGQEEPKLLEEEEQQQQQTTDNDNNSNNDIDGNNQSKDQNKKDTTTAAVGGGLFSNFFFLLDSIPTFPIMTTTTTTSSSSSSSSSSPSSSSTDITIVRPIYLVGESFGGILAFDVAVTLLKEQQKQQQQQKGKNRRDDVTTISSSTTTSTNNNNNIKRRISNLKGLIVINPATCYDRSQLASLGPTVYKLPTILYIPGLLRLLPLFTDEYSLEQLLLILQAKGLPSVIDTPQREAYMGRVAFSLPTKLTFMPPGTLEWRLTQWLSVGCRIVAGEEDEEEDDDDDGDNNDTDGYENDDDIDDNSYSFASFFSFSNSNNKNSNKNKNNNNNILRELATKFPTFRTLIIAGEKDLTLPSIAEAERIASILPSKYCHVHVVEGAGHASTCGSRVDLTALLRSHFPELLSSKQQQQLQQQQNNNIEKQQPSSFSSSSLQGNTRHGNNNNNNNTNNNNNNTNGAKPETISPNNSNKPFEKRTAMKNIAAQGKGPYFGMEPRYDGADIGLNPILYWSKENYQNVIKTEELRIIIDPNHDGAQTDQENNPTNNNNQQQQQRNPQTQQQQQQRMYKKASYSIGEKPQ